MAKKKDEIDVPEISNWLLQPLKMEGEGFPANYTEASRSWEQPSITASKKTGIGVP